MLVQDEYSDTGALWRWCTDGVSVPLTTPWRVLWDTLRVGTSHQWLAGAVVHERGACIGPCRRAVARDGSGGARSSRYPVLPLFGDHQFYNLLITSGGGK